MQLIEEYKPTFRSLKERAHPTLFARLVWSEYLRVARYLIGFIGLLIIFQLVAFFYHATGSVGIEGSTAYHIRMRMEAATDGLLFNTPIVISAVGLLFYSILSWYKEWFGKHTFIYRLMMLPIDRLVIFLAKLLSIFMGIATLILFQIGLLYIGQFIMVSINFGIQIPPLSISSLMEIAPAMQLIFPLDLGLLVIQYSLGLLFMVILFTAIVIERSFAYIGFLLGAIYGGLHFYLFLLSSFALGLWYDLSLDGNLIFNWFNFSILIIIAFSLSLSHYLMNNRLTV